jgi:hypothetical protein
VAHVLLLLLLLLLLLAGLLHMLNMPNKSVSSAGQSCQCQSTDAALTTHADLHAFWCISYSAVISTIVRQQYIDPFGCFSMLIAHLASFSVVPVLVIIMLCAVRCATLALHACYLHSQ